MAFAFDNSYSRLPERFYSRLDPVKVSSPSWLKFNERLAVEMGLDVESLRGEKGVEIFSGNRVPAGAAPLAMAYAGHQFGNFVPQLGDGRAILLGEVLDKSGRRWDLHFKGSGPTPFSRGGDGRAALGPVLREYIISEGMYALGIPTTRTLAAVATGDSVFRETPLPGAILTRVGASHLRIGTFEYFAAQGDHEAVKILADYAIERHYPEISNEGEKYIAFLKSVLEAQASLVAKWMRVGFIHGVMNTDNMTISGETIDYGPCAFMDEYDPLTVFSSIDRRGRYAFGRQPQIAQWNLARLAEALLPLFSGSQEEAVELATEVVQGFTPVFERFFLKEIGSKFGLFAATAKDHPLIQSFLDLMVQTNADYTNTFRGLLELPLAKEKEAWGQSLLGESDAAGKWVEDWLLRLRDQTESLEKSVNLMRQVNPAYIPRNHQVERALESARDGDLKVMETLLEVIGHPYEERPQFEEYTHPPTPSERVVATFCGT